MPGSVLISPETLELAEGYVVVKSLGPRPIKGLSVPVEVYEMTGAATVRSRFQAVAVIAERGASSRGARPTVGGADVTAGWAGRGAGPAPRIRRPRPP